MSNNANEQSLQQRIAEMEVQLAAANEQLQVAKDALETVEWISSLHGDLDCPWCGGFGTANLFDENMIKPTHTPDCKRQLALAAIAEKEGK